MKWEMVYPQYAPQLVFRGNIVRVGKLPFQTGTTGEAFFFPPNTDFSNNTLVWDGTGPVPTSLTDWFNAAHTWEFVHEAGKTFTDTGSANCH